VGDWRGTGNRQQTVEENVSLQPIDDRFHDHGGREGEGEEVWFIFGEVLLTASPKSLWSIL
jgi:hypothetical protein